MRTPELCRAIIRLACRAFPKGRREQAEREYIGDLVWKTSDKAELSQIAFALNVLLIAAPKAAAATTLGWSEVRRLMAAVQIAGMVMLIPAGVSALLIHQGVVNPIVLFLVKLGGYGYAAATLCFVLFLWHLKGALAEEGVFVGWWPRTIMMVLNFQLVFWTLMAASLVGSALQTPYYMNSIVYTLVNHPLQTMFGPFLAPAAGLTGLVSALGLVQAFIGMGVYLACTFTLERKLKQFAEPAN